MSKQSTWTLSIIAIVTVIFVVLKLLSLIEWDWLWIFSPVWIPALIMIGTYFSDIRRKH